MRQSELKFFEQGTVFVTIKKSSVSKSSTFLKKRYTLILVYDNETKTLEIVVDSHWKTTS